MLFFWKGGGGWNIFKKKYAGMKPPSIDDPLYSHPLLLLSFSPCFDIFLKTPPKEKQDK